MRIRRFLRRHTGWNRAYLSVYGGNGWFNQIKWENENQPFRTKLFLSVAKRWDSLELPCECACVCVCMFFWGTNIRYALMILRLATKCIYNAIQLANDEISRKYCRHISHGLNGSLMRIFIFVRIKCPSVYGLMWYEFVFSEAASELKSKKNVYTPYTIWKTKLNWHNKLYERQSNKDKHSRRFTLINEYNECDNYNHR